MSWMKGLLLIACLVGVYFLYDNGYLITKSKKALTFVGSGMGKRNCFGFQFTKCTGYVGRVLRVKESGTYAVNLDASLSGGTVRFLLQDSAKTPLVILTPDLIQGRVQLETGKRYYIRMEFDHASGDSKASWEKE